MTTRKHLCRAVRILISDYFVRTSLSRQNCIFHGQSVHDSGWFSVPYAKTARGGVFRWGLGTIFVILGLSQAEGASIISVKIQWT